MRSIGKLGTRSSDSSSSQKHKNKNMFRTDLNEEEYSFRISNTSDASRSYHDRPPKWSSDSSPYNTTSRELSSSQHLTPLDQSSPFPGAPLDPSSPLSRSPWSCHAAPHESYSYTGLMGSLVREEGHIYSLATSGDLLYTGSDSKNIRVWKNQKEFSGFKSNSGLVKAIIIAGEKIFTGHQDGKIRVWKISSRDPSIHKRIGTLPTLKAYIKSSILPGSYADLGRNRNAVWIKHSDAISSLSLTEDRSLLYSASWDKTIKVWRVSNSKCLESINAHDDAVNSVIAGFDGLVFSGSADGSVKVWRREMQGKGTKHFFSQTLLKQECAVTALAVDHSASVLYCGSSDGLVNFWERSKLLSHGGVLRGHKLAVLCLAAAKNLVFSGSADSNICVWKKDGNEHTCLSVLSGHSGPVKCLAVEEEKTPAKNDRQWIVYSGSLDKSVKIWRVSGQLATMPMNAQHQGQTEGQSSDLLAIPSVQGFPSQSNRVTNQMRKY